LSFGGMLALPIEDSPGGIVGRQGTNLNDDGDAHFNVAIASAPIFSGA
jgi:hypothetical protein